MLKSCASLTILFHRGLAEAIWTLLLYRFSNLSCSWGVSLLKSGGHTFLSLYGLTGRSNCDFERWAARRTNVENIIEVRLGRHCVPLLRLCLLGCRRSLDMGRNLFLSAAVPRCHELKWSQIVLRHRIWTSHTSRKRFVCCGLPPLPFNPSN